MTRHLLRRTIVRRPLDETFAFFSRAEELEGITPPWLGFRILTPTPFPMEVGTRIDYRLRLRGIPLRWQSEITAWEPRELFVDEQRRGPFRLWRHLHRFRAVPGGTLVEDDVEYAVPGGSIVDRLFVAPELGKIFSFRQQRIRELLGSGPELVVPDESSDRSAA